MDFYILWNIVQIKERNMKIHWKINGIDLASLKKAIEGQTDYYKNLVCFALFKVSVTKVPVINFFAAYYHNWHIF